MSNQKDKKTGVEELNSRFAHGLIQEGAALKNDSSHNFAEVGGEYLEAAEVLNNTSPNEPRRTTFANVFQALELYLKSFLLRKGKTLQYVEKTICHKVEDAIRECQELGWDEESLKEINEVSRSYTAKDFHYRSNGTWKMVEPAVLIAFVKFVRDAIKSG
jgi:HEPN domain-containing protein